MTEAIFALSGVIVGYIVAFVSEHLKRKHEMRLHNLDKKRLAYLNLAKIIIDIESYEKSVKSAKGLALAKLMQIEYSPEKKFDKKINIGDALKDFDSKFMGETIVLESYCKELEKIVCYTDAVEIALIGSKSVRSLFDKLGTEAKLVINLHNAIGVHFAARNLHRVIIENDLLRGESNTKHMELYKTWEKGGAITEAQVDKADKLIKDKLDDEDFGIIRKALEEYDQNFRKKIFVATEELEKTRNNLLLKMREELGN